MGLFDVSILHKFALAYTTVGIIFRELDDLKIIGIHTR